MKYCIPDRTQRTMNAVYTWLVQVGDYYGDSSDQTNEHVGVNILDTIIRTQRDSAMTCVIQYHKQQ